MYHPTLNNSYLPKNSFDLLRVTAIDNGEVNRNAFYDQLRSYYLQNGLYDPMTSSSFYLKDWVEAMKSLYTVSHRVVEFYVSKLEPGTVPDALPIEAKNKSLVEPIEQIWLWSNLAETKPAILRDFALYGDLFIHSRISTDRQRVFQKYYSPRYVTEFQTDNRKNISSIRIDVPNGDGTYTEMWNMEGYRIWENQEAGVGAEEKQMGNPDITGTLASLGIDFVPFTHARFQDIGESREWAVSFMQWIRLTKRTAWRPACTRCYSVTTRLCLW